MLLIMCDQTTNQSDVNIDLNTKMLVGSIFNTFPNKPRVFYVCCTSLLKTLGKEKLLLMSNFSFSHSVSYSFGELAAIFIIRPLKTGRIMGSPMAGGRPGGRRPVLCPEHISKTTLARVMKFHGWIDLIEGECSAKES